VVLEEVMGVALEVEAVAAAVYVAALQAVTEAGAGAGAHNERSAVSMPAAWETSPRAVPAEAAEAAEAVLVSAGVDEAVVGAGAVPAALQAVTEAGAGAPSVFVLEAVLWAVLEQAVARAGAHILRRPHSVFVAAALEVVTVTVAGGLEAVTGPGAYILTRLVSLLVPEPEAVRLVRAGTYFLMRRHSHSTPRSTSTSSPVTSAFSISDAK